MKTGLIIGLGILVLVVVAVISGFFIFGNSYSSTDNSQNLPNNSGNIVNNQSNGTQNESPPANQSSPQTYNIEISSFAFKQSRLTINIGDTVIWTNKDSASHTVTSDSGTELDSSSLSKNGMYSHTFTTVGTFDYHCAFHSNMKAKIIVG